MPSDVQWIKITTNMFDDEKIRVIESMPDADSLLIIWIKLLTQAGRTNAGGYIFLTESIPLTDEMIATLFHRPVATVRLALNTFSKFGMIQIKDGNLFITNWNKYQNIEGMEKVKELARERQQRHRLALKEGDNVTSRDSHVTVTLLDKDIDKDIKNKKNTINNIVLPDWINKDIWDAYIEMRRKKRKPATYYAASLVIKELESLMKNGNDPNKVLEKSIVNCWTYVFQLNNDNGVKLQ